MTAADQGRGGPRVRRGIRRETVVRHTFAACEDCGAVWNGPNAGAVAAIHARTADHRARAHYSVVVAYERAAGATGAGG